MKKLLTIALSLTIGSLAQATIVKSIHMKNGSVYNGYIERQDTLGNYSVRTENAIISLVNERVATAEDTLRGARFFKDITINKVTYDESSLSEDWKDWAEKN